MAELFDEPDAPKTTGNAPEFSVTELSGAIKRTIEQGFSHVRVRAEVGRVMRARSGHVYFDLKDDRSVIGSVAWKGVAARLEVQPEEGMEVIATGRISTFGQQSKYQLIVESLAPAGVGALMAMLEKRRLALQAEGLFAVDRKQPLPYLPEVIGVVTSMSGAVIRDILHRLRDRFPREVVIWPVTVQGANCAAEVAAAIRGFNALGPDSAVPRPDVLIVARGGGSVEDLWGFNEEVVVRAAAESRIPLISAVGHETDTTLIDHAADIRAPTPTAAAELAVPVRLELMAALAGLENRRIRAGTGGLGLRQERLRDLARLLPRPQALLGERQQAYDGIAERLPRALTSLAQSRRLALSQRTGRFGPLVLKGFLQQARDRVQRRGEVLHPRLGQAVRSARERFVLRRDQLRAEPIRRTIAEAGRHLSETWRDADTALAQVRGRQSERLDGLERLRQTLGYRATLQRGYAVIRDAAGGAVIADQAKASQLSGIEIEFRDGRLAATPVATADKPAVAPSKAAPAKRKSGRSGDDGQGSLF